MKLNSDIIFDSLSQSVALERYGSQKQALELKRPLLYTEVKKNSNRTSFMSRFPANSRPAQSFRAEEPPSSASEGGLPPST